MACQGWHHGLPAALGAFFWSVAAIAGGASPRPSPQTPPGDPTMPVLTIEQLVRLSPAELDQLYTNAAPGAIPGGKVRGRTIPYPGTKLAAPASKASKLIWQGKIFDGSRSMAVNRFFGIKMIKANVGYGESWLDGRPSIILDYSQTSIVYANYRDEVREIAPGLYLGLMYARTTPPRNTLYFVLQTCP